MPGVCALPIRKSLEGRRVCYHLGRGRISAAKAAHAKQTSTNKGQHIGQAYGLDVCSALAVVRGRSATPLGDLAEEPLGVSIPLETVWGQYSVSQRGKLTAVFLSTGASSESNLHPSGLYDLPLEAGDTSAQVGIAEFAPGTAKKYAERQGPSGTSPPRTATKQQRQQKQQWRRKEVRGVPPAYEL